MGEQPANIKRFALFNGILADYQKLCERFKALQGDTPDENELKAGIEHLSKYGEYLTMLNLSGGDILKMRDIASLSTAEVLTYVSASKDVRTYQNELLVLRKPK